MKRKIAAVMAADIAGYGQLVAEDPDETQRRLESYRAVFGDFVSRSSGRIVKAPGNQVLAEFSSAVEAVRCAIDVQESLRTRNLAYPPSRQMRFRIAITIGDVVEQNGDLLGDGVNVAARLQGLAQPGGLCVSRAVYEQVVNKLSVEFIDIGEQKVQSLPAPVRAYTLTLGASGTSAGAPARQRASKGTIGIWPATIAAALVTAFATGALLYVTTPKSGPAPETVPAPSPLPAPVVQVTPPPPPPAQRRTEELVPERVPFITDRQRLAVRNEYLAGPNHKRSPSAFSRAGSSPTRLMMRSQRLPRSTPARKIRTTSTSYSAANSMRSGPVSCRPAGALRGRIIKAPSPAQSSHERAGASPATARSRERLRRSGHHSKTADLLPSPV
jgi:adenylate cyclase